MEYAENDKSVVVTGKVEDVREHLKTSAVSVTPIRIGAGIQNKILEAMSMGIPVVTSDIGANPITKDRNILPVAETEEEYANIICEIMQNRDLRLKLSEVSMKFVEDNFSKKRFITEMDKYFS